MKLADELAHRLVIYFAGLLAGRQQPAEQDLGVEVFCLQNFACFPEHVAVLGWVDFLVLVAVIPVVRLIPDLPVVGHELLAGGAPAEGSESVTLKVAP
jgi:hypothetical protein